MRVLIAFAMLGQGIIRAIDGLMFATSHLEFAPQWLWALAQIVCGGLLLLTHSDTMRHNLAGRVVASISCGLFVALAAAVYPTAATSAIVALLFAWVLFLEAGPSRGC